MGINDQNRVARCFSNLTVFPIHSVPNEITHIRCLVLWIRETTFMTNATGNPVRNKVNEFYKKGWHGSLWLAESPACSLYSRHFRIGFHSELHAVIAAQF